ncbi:MAG: SMC-Scp complex subunit ScpB [Thermoanaerobaculum sp.]|nr:SMC-Scp complex subunit ScpB [Thermoanaerobaculum sp.]
MPDHHLLAAACEAILAVAGEPVSEVTLLKTLGGEVSPEDLAAALEHIRQRHEHLGSGLRLEKVAGGYRLATRPEVGEVVRAFLGIRAQSRLSQAALETLAIIAYRQPVTLPEINFLRGVNSSGVVRTLLERKLIRVAGRKQVVGTPLLYRTTKELLVLLGLQSLDELPTLEELGEAEGSVAP